MTRARQVANFDPALFAADEVSGDKVSGGTIGAGVIGASVTGGAGLSGSTSLGTVTTGTLGSGVNLDSATFPAGHIIQVLTGTNSAEAFTQSVGFVTMSLTATITPRNASSKFFIVCNTSGYNNGGSDHVGYYTIYRDSTNLGPANGYADIYLGSGSGHDLGSNICISELDSPNTANSITYGMYVRCSNTSDKVYWSMNHSKSDITVMEIAG